MRHRITVGDVDIRTDLDLTARQLRRLLMDAAGIAAALSSDSPDDTPDRPALGFTAHLDLDPDRNTPDDPSEWFEESP